MADGKVEMENVNHPGRPTRVDAAKYAEVRGAMLAVLGETDRALSYDEWAPAVKARLSERLFPGGATAGWWCKGVQLDLEAKGLISREAGKPLRWRRVSA